MSLKLVELQIALPKTYEAGKVQEQLNQQPAIQQQQLAQAQAHRELARRAQVNRFDESNKAQLTKQQEETKKHPAHQSKVVSPKGHFFDATS